MRNYQQFIEWLDATYIGRQYLSRLTAVLPDPNSVTCLANDRYGEDLEIKFVAFDASMLVKGFLKFPRPTPEECMMQLEVFSLSLVKSKLLSYETYDAYGSRMLDGEFKELALTLTFDGREITLRKTDYPHQTNLFDQAVTALMSSR
ncbi:hypothetical protein OS242_10510 [Tumebacillus sp. DT12]|uniref:Uncharacterized protein n=1 Tax=Tumebacillus lacus TaxID=2995335 RepID=A0ABT3X6M2_9BACL|nr:hypothetical protein [Tumebacillus lacus]MCX7570394.1 hypothetical protein [Tumebacillus lacus]